MPPKPLIVEISAGKGLIPNAKSALSHHLPRPSCCWFCRWRWLSRLWFRCCCRSWLWRPTQNLLHLLVSQLPQFLRQIALPQHKFYIVLASLHRNTYLADIILAGPCYLTTLRRPPGRSCCSGSRPFLLVCWPCYHDLITCNIFPGASVHHSYYIP